MDVLIIGCGGHGREMARLVANMRAAGQDVTPAGFIDDDLALHGQTIQGLPVLGGLEALPADKKNFALVCAIGNPRARKLIVEKLQADGVQWMTLIDPDVPLSTDAAIGEGAMICAGTRMTTNLKIGKHAIVNLGCTLSHDVELGDYGTLACGVRASGNVTIETGADLGVGVNLIPGVVVGAWSIIGAGAAVIKDVPQSVTAVGVPAKVIKEHQ